MKKNHLWGLLLLLLLSSCESCIEGEEPDLYWLDEQPFYNACTGQYELLNVSHLFWVNNLNNPNYPPQVLLYYNAQSGIFTDCLGFQWFILEGSLLISNRYMTNKMGGATAKSPSARAHVTVRESNGQTHETTGDLVTFNDLPPGQTATFNTTIAIGKNNSQYLTEYVADPLDAIAESDESNNASSDGFSRSDGAGSVSFKINVPSEEELARIKTRYIVYRSGEIEVRN